MDHGGRHSLAAGVVGSIKPVKQYIDDIIREAGQIVKEFKRWGMFEDGSG
jgi:hypothetical protein